MNRDYCKKQCQRGGGHHQDDENTWRMAQRAKANAGKNRRGRVTFMLLGLLFLKFSVLLVFISLLFVFYSKLYQQVSQISGRSCENEWLEFEKHCYFLSTFQLTWKKAENMCLNRGGHLAIIDSLKEQNFLDQSRRERFLWIGLTDEEVENTFKWVDGTTLARTSFSYWDEGEPNNRYEVEHCAQMWHLGKWNDQNCNDTYYAVCEKPLY